MGLKQECVEYFNTDNLYVALGVSPPGTEEKIMLAYLKVVMLCHPDQVANDKKELATKKFQILSKIHYVLSKKEHGSFFSETGEIDEQELNVKVKNWAEYWKLVFPRGIRDYTDQYITAYKGSNEEQMDLIQCYLQYHGDMDKISKYLLGYNADDEDRYRRMIKKLVQKNNLLKNWKYVKEDESKENAGEQTCTESSSETDQTCDCTESSSETDQTCDCTESSSEADQTCDSTESSSKADQTSNSTESESSSETAYICICTDSSSGADQIPEDLREGEHVVGYMYSVTLLKAEEL